MRTMCCVGGAVALLAADAMGAFTVTSFPAASWGASDATLGVTGYVIENFEDVNLVPQLQVTVANGSGGYGPTGTLPNLMSQGPDPFGSAFVNAAWDGTHVLINTSNNQAQNYTNAPNWAGTMTFTIVGGAMSVGFSLEQMQTVTVNHIFINGTDMGTTGAFLGVTNSGSRNGYFRIDSNSAPITTIAFTSQGDGYAFDHFAIAPAPGTAAVGGLGLLALGKRRRR